MFNRVSGSLLFVYACFTGAASAATINITMDTTSLVENVADQPYHIQFTLTNAELLTSHSPGGPRVNPSNIVTASNFDFGDGYGIDPAADPGYLVDGGASGDIRSTVLMKANHPINYFSQGFVAGSTLSFTLEFTHNIAVSHSLFDIFSFIIIDSQYTEIPTQGGQSHHAFLEIDFNSDDPHVLTFASDATKPTSAGEFISLPAPTYVAVPDTVVPEPQTFLLAGAALLALWVRKSSAKHRKAVLSGLPLIAVLSASALMAAPSEVSPETFEGKYRGRNVRFAVLNGLAIAEGDMVIGEATIEESLEGVRTARLTTFEPQTRKSAKDRNDKFAHSVEGSSHLWPKVSGVVTVPYTITRGGPKMTEALNQFNALFAGKIAWIPRTNQRAYVDINLGGQSTNSCYATLGYTGTKAILQGVEGGCAVFAMLHEMAHVLGLAHEQSRADRDQYLKIDFSNIAFGSRGAYNQEVSGNVDLGLFDYASLMHYAPRGFSRNGNPEMESIPRGIPFGDPPTFSPGDMDVLNRLYFSAPTAVTVDTLPTGLPIVVDGLTHIAPKTFNWAINSAHTIDVVPGPQTIPGATYLFGRWNNDLNGDLNPSRTITVAPGDGSFGHPTSAPAVTFYAASYMKLMEFKPSYILDNVFSTSSEAGTVAINPAPATFPGLPGTYFVDRQLVTLTAMPATGNNFHDFSGDNTYLQTFGPATNPLTLPSDMLAGNFYVNFTTQPEVYVTTNVTDNNASGIGVTADGGEFKSLFAAWTESYDSGWGALSTHSLTASSPVSPHDDAATRYTFANWSDGVTSATRTIQVPASGRRTIGANYKTWYRVTANVESACAGRAVVSPNLPADSFLVKGSSVSVTAIPTSPWVFAGWTGTQTTSANPLATTVGSEIIATANFNVINSRLTITSLSPATVQRGSQARTLTITGSGFTADTAFFLGDTYVPTTLVSSTTLTANVPASLFTTADDLSTIVENVVSDCSVYLFGPTLHVVP